MERPQSVGTAFRYRIFNADDNEAKQRGNGVQCFARYVYDNGLIAAMEMMVETAAVDIILKIEADSQVTVNMGSPTLKPADTPFKAKAYALNYALSVSHKQIEICALPIGESHAVLRVEDVRTAAVSELWPHIESPRRFLYRVIVGLSRS